MRGRTKAAPGTDRWSRSDWWGPVLQTPDPAALARFYLALLDWEAMSQEPSWWVIGPGEGVCTIGFQREAGYVRPVWPSAPGEQQMMMHLDLEVSDLALSVEHAIELGAVLSDFQPQDDVRVMLDPDGHPFCLYLGTPPEESA
jgi:hypothetical protein